MSQSLEDKYDFEIKTYEKNIKQEIQFNRSYMFFCSPLYTKALHFILEL